jgi:hypothetical protein
LSQRLSVLRTLWGNEAVERIILLAFEPGVFRRVALTGG